MIYRLCWWIKTKKATISPIIKKDNKCFQYALTVTKNHEQIVKHSQRVTKIKPFINKYNWDKINFSSKKMIGKQSRKIM